LRREKSCCWPADVGNGTGVSLDADGPIAAGAIVTEAADPGEAVSEFGHDALEHTDVALAVFPDLEGRNGLGEAGDLIGRKCGPIAGVESEREACGVGDSPVVVDPAGFWGIDVVRGHDEESIGAGALHAAGHIGADDRVIADAGDDGHAAAGGADGRGDDLLGFLGGEGVDFTSAAGGNNGAIGVLGHLIHIFLEGGEIQGKVWMEGRDGETENATELIAKLGGHEEP